MTSGSEFDVIARYFKPLANGEPGALGLLDDGALLNLPEGHQLVVTTDALVSGVHFLDTQSPEDIAHKVVGVNLSDLAAMGATPRAVFLAAQFPNTITTDWLEKFTGGLSSSLALSGAVLMGGDTVSTPGPLAFTLTALGYVRQGKALTRGGAGVGDLLYVSGTIGDGALGLLCLNGTLERQAELELRYARPQPRWALGQALSTQGLATACVDISDGLIADVEHICEVSGVGCSLETQKVPLSPAAKHLLKQDTNLMEQIICGGDDYELAFTVNPAQTARIETLARALDIPLTCIGKITAGDGVRVLNDQGHELEIQKAGYCHL